jgi:hypothetical protein
MASSKAIEVGDENYEDVGTSIWSRLLLSD